ncbi:MAG TPA: hypothetical protein VF904_18770 [Anaeromyxobacteraceae bacterium]
MVKRLDDAVRAIEARLRSFAALRLRVRLARYQNALLAAVIGLGILLMIIHWAGSPPARAPHAAAAPAEAAAHRTVPQP